jgi:hypothetical protein
MTQGKGRTTVAIITDDGLTTHVTGWPVADGSAPALIEALSDLYGYPRSSGLIGNVELQAEAERSAAMVVPA